MKFIILLGFIIAAGLAVLLFNILIDDFIPLPTRIVIAILVGVASISILVSVRRNMMLEAEAQEQVFNMTADVTLYEHGEIVYHTDNARGIFKYNGYVSLYDMETNEDVWLYGTIVIRRKGQ